MARAVEQRLGRPVLVSPSQADLSIEGRAEATGDPTRLRAVLVMRDATGTVLGTREFEEAATDCVALRDAVALAVALMIDPDAVLHPAVRPPPPVAVPPPCPVEATPRAAGPVVSAPSQTWRVWPSAGAAVGYGFLPAPSVGLQAGVTVLPPKFWPIEMVTVAWGPQILGAEGGTSTRFTYISGALAVCPLYVEGGRGLSFRACAGPAGGVLTSAGSGFVASRTDSKPTVHAAADAHVVLPLASRVAIDLGGSLDVSLLWNEYVYEDASGKQSLFDSSRIAATGVAGLAVTLP
jgi:hypothetical protein